MALLGTLVEAQGLAAAEELTAHRPTPLLHVTDLYHPHNDPDDHWDVATVYALAKMERVRLLGVLIDYPLKTKPDAFGGPAVQAVAQLNHIAGFAVPVAVGASVSYSDVVSGAAQLADWDRRGVDFILETLRSAPEPVAISVVGSCRDVALAGREHPEVFREKCRGIYLNAGTGTFDPAKGANQEWNVMLDPARLPEHLRDSLSGLLVAVFRRNEVAQRQRPGGLSARKLLALSSRRSATASFANVHKISFSTPSPATPLRVG